MKKQTPEELEQIQQAILEREVEEELQKERLLNFWKKYRLLIIGGVIAVILSTAGTELYHSWKSKIRTAESNLFESAVLKSVTGEAKQAKAELDTLSSTAKTNYKQLATLRSAGINLQNNEKEEALQKIKAVMDDTSAPDALKSVALLSYVGHQSNKENADALISLLEPLLNPQSEFFHPATELKVSLLLKQNKKDDAKKTLQNALLNPHLTPVVTERLNALLSAIKE